MKKIVSVRNAGFKSVVFDGDFTLTKVPNGSGPQIDVLIKKSPIRGDGDSHWVLAKYTRPGRPPAYLTLRYNNLNDANEQLSHTQFFIKRFRVPEDVLRGLCFIHWTPDMIVPPAPPVSPRRSTATLDRRRPPVTPDRRRSSVGSLNPLIFEGTPGPAASAAPEVADARPALPDRCILPNRAVFDFKRHVQKPSTRLELFLTDPKYVLIRRSDTKKRYLVLSFRARSGMILQLKSTIPLSDDSEKPGNIKNVIDDLFQKYKDLLGNSDPPAISDPSKLKVLTVPVQLFQLTDAGKIEVHLPDEVRGSLMGNPETLRAFYNQTIKSLINSTKTSKADRLALKELKKSKLVEGSEQAISLSVGRKVDFDQLPPIFKAQNLLLRKSPIVQLTFFQERVPILYPGYESRLISISPAVWPDLGAVTFEKTVVHATSLLSFILLILNGPSRGHRNIFGKGFYTSELLTDDVVDNYGRGSDMGFGFAVVYFALYSDNAVYVDKSAIDKKVKGGYTVVQETDVLVPFAAAIAGQSSPDFEGGFETLGYVSELLGCLNSGARASEQRFDLWFPLAYFQEIPSNYYRTDVTKWVLARWKKYRADFSGFLDSIKRWCSNDPAMNNPDILQPVLMAVSKLALDASQKVAFKQAFPTFECPDSSDA